MTKYCFCIYVYIYIYKHTWYKLNTNSKKNFKSHEEKRFIVLIEQIIKSTKIKYSVKTLLLYHTGV